MKKIFIFILVMISIHVDMSAQRKRTTTSTRSSRTAKTEESFTKNLIYELRLGNIGLGNPVSLSFKPGIGYKLNKTFSAGLNSRLFYDYYNSIGSNDASYFSYGANVYARGKITNSIFLSGEYGFTKFDRGSTSVDLYFPTVGGGYISPGNGKWSYGAEIFLPLDNTARDLVGTVEYWIGFYYNLGGE